MKAFSRLSAQNAKSKVTGYWLIVTLAGLGLVTPLLRWSNGPCTHDGHLHYHRLAAMRYAWESGLPFSRWLPDLAFGYGYPFFVYREAAPLYLSLIPHLFGLPLPAATNLVYALTILAAGWFMFLWVRDIFGPLSGVVSAVAYMAAPYLFIDALVRGNLPESLALPLFPLLCWAGRRFILKGTTGSFVIAALGLAFLALSHNISTLLFVPLLFLYLLIVAWMAKIAWSKVTVRLLIIFVLGLGLSAFYTGPAVLELDEITISQSVTTRNNDWRFNFASLDEIFSPVSPADPGLLNPPLLIRLGWAPALLALLGLISLAWTRSREQRGHIMMMALAIVGLLFMSLNASWWLWDNLPLIEYVQFPWRFVGRAALPVAFLAGVPFANLKELFPERRVPAWLVPSLAIGAVTLLLLETLPNLYRHICSEEPYPSIMTVHAYERETGLVGVDPEGSYFPKTVLSRPDGSPLEADYEAGRPPQRFDAATLPDGASVIQAEYRPTSAQIKLESPVPFQATYLTYAFPGWRVLVDGHPAPITPGDPDGLITFPVPAGSHVVDIRWRMTPLRAAMTAISIVSVVGLLVVAIVLTRNGNNRRQNEGQERLGQGAPNSDGDAARRTTRIYFLLLLAVALSFLAFKVLIVDRIETPFRRESKAETDFPANLTGAQLQLEGFNLSREVVAAGETFDIDLAWRVLESPAADYQSNIWLVGPEGLSWSDKETQRPRIYEDTAPTRFWLPGQWAWDSREVQVLPGAPHGSYDIVLTLFGLADLQPITLNGSDGTILGPAAVIGQIEVVSPDSPPEFEPQFTLDETIANLKLLGYNQDRQEAAPGEQFLLTFFWEKPAGEKSSPTTLNLVLVDKTGRPIQTWVLPPVQAGYGPDEWQEGERLRGQHSLRLAAGLESGNYSFELEGQPLGQMTIQAPARLFDEPGYVIPVGATFDDQALLVGYSLNPPVPEAQAPLAITLLWQALAEMPVSYRVFVHLIDENGQIVDQSDGEPAVWTRPTTGWAPGEYVLDEHLLRLPAGLDAANMALRIGLYDADTGQRLETSGDEFIILPLLTDTG